MESASTLTEKQTTAYPWFWLTGERVLYIGIAALSLVIHLAWLGHWPLLPTEAANALTAWRTLHPGLSLPGRWSPLLVSAQMGLFGIFTATEFSARLLPALAGISLSLLPVLWRRELGRIGAFAAAVLTLVSPALLYFSGTADGIFLAGALCAWAFSLAYRAVTDARPQCMAAAAVLVSLALAAAPNVYTWLVTAFLLGLTWYLTRCQAEQRALRDLLRPYLTIKVGLAFLVGWLLGATAFLTNLAGLNQAVQLPWLWLRNFSLPSNPLGWYGMARNLLVYEPLLLLLALYGAIILFKRRSPVTTWLLAWFGLAAVLSWLSSGGQPAFITDVLWPLLVLAAYGTASLWLQMTQHAVPGSLAVLGPLLALLGFTCLQLVEYAKVPDKALLAYAGVGLALVSIGWAGYWLWSNRAAALRIGAVMLFVLTAVYTVRADSALLYQTGADPREGYVSQPVSPALPDMAQFLATQSNHLWGDAHAASVSYPSDLDPLVGWVLRDFSITSYQGAGAGTSADAIVLPYTPDTPGPHGYIGQRFIRYPISPRQPVTLSNSLRWFLLREPIGVLEYDQLELWLAVPKTTQS
ncbi:MAG: hypothetical protein ACYC6L_00900 [Anaerolineae bacterium]